jgi:hypothetical protein
MPRRWNVDHTNRGSKDFNSHEKHKKTNVASGAIDVIHVILFVIFVLFVATPVAGFARIRTTVIQSDACP